MASGLNKMADELDGMADAIAGGLRFGTIEAVRFRDMAVELRAIRETHHAQLNQAQESVYRCGIAWAAMVKATREAEAIMRDEPIPTPTPRADPSASLLPGPGRDG